MATDLLKPIKLANFSKTFKNLQTMSDLLEKEKRAIKLLRTVAKTTDGEIELSYSGGKDSDVCLALAQMAGIPYRAIYNNTTIDPPGTIAHCKAAARRSSDRRGRSSRSLSKMDSRLDSLGSAVRS